MENENSMGSLAQAARGNQLKSARWIMIVLGILSVVVNGAMIYVAQQQLDKEVSELSAQGMVVAEADVNAARLQNTLVFGAGVLLGFIFIALGVMVYTFPVPCTVAALVLYVGAALVFGIMDPSTIAKGVIIKVFIVIGLVKSVQSALAYQAEMKKEYMSPPAGGGADSTSF